MAKKDYTNWDRKDLVNEIEQLRKRKKYGLVWEDKPEDVVEQCKNELPILEEVNDKEISTEPDKAINLLIEGDNYHALSVLNYTHKGKVDVIYIDPPYNTGENDFKYNDTFIDQEDPYKHSKWLSFMNSRLSLSKSLLRKDGIIFISINDIEGSQLKIMCDEIFGEHNFYGKLTWINRTKSTNSGKAKRMIQQQVEYILVYGQKKQTDYEGFRLLFSGEEKNYPHEGKLGKCRFENIEATDYGRKKRDTMKFPILGIKPRAGRRWQIGEKLANELVSKGKIEIVDGVPKRAYYPEDDEYNRPFVPFWSHLQDVGTAESGKKELSQIVGPEHGFDTVKPLPLIHRILDRFHNNITVLDFFAGSGTTGQAVLEMNKIDDGNRKFILCTNNENKIAEEVCLPRLNKVISGYDYSGTEKTILYENKLTTRLMKDANTILEEIESLQEKNSDKYDKFETKIEDNNIRLYGINKHKKKKPGLGGNLKYFRTGFVPADPTDKNKVALTKKATEMLCVKEDTFDEVKSTDKYQIFRNKKRHTGIIFDHLAISEFKDEIKEIDGKFSVYVFSLGDDTFDEEFEDIKDKVKLSPIPEAILRVYRRIFK